MSSISALFAAAVVAGTAAAIYRVLRPAPIKKHKPETAAQPSKTPSNGVDLIEDPKTGVYRPK